MHESKYLKKQSHQLIVKFCDNFSLIGTYVHYASEYN